MKFITRKNSMTRKILIILLVALILIFAVTPNYSVHAVTEESGTEEITQEDMPDEGDGILGSLLKQIIQIFAAIGDIAMGTLNHFMLGADGFTSAMLAPSNDNIGNSDSWLYVGDDEEIDYHYGEGTINTAEFFSWIMGEQYDIPNFLYSPENIFANNIAALDVNFLNPNDFEAVSSTSDAEQASQSAAGGVLQQTISDWYISFRNIAIVGLLSVLVYIGIRILISSTASDKAKYKESLQNWVVALCLVFFIHFIMSGLLMITDKFTDLISSTIDDGITVQVDDGNIKFRTNIIGLVRFNAQSKSMYNTAAYTILYLVLVIYTFIFTFMYFKRFLYMAFFTMIAPLVALTYPIDKAGDGKAQAFNLWFKEYSMNLILQPVHLILYVALVSSAMELVQQNMIYAIVAIGFLIPAEKFIKKMFGMDKAETPSGFGSFAAGAATMSGIKSVASMLSGGKDKKGSNGKGEGIPSAVDKNANKVRTQDRDFLGSFRNEQGGDDNATNNISGELDEGPNQREEESSNIGGMDRLTQNGELQGEQQDENMPGFLENEGYRPDENHAGILLPSSYRMDQQQQEASEQREQQDELQQQELQQQALQPQSAGDNTSIPDSNKPSWEELQEARRQQQVAQRRNYMKKRAIRGVKKAGKFALKGGKIAAQGLGIAAGATAGLIAGTATGDFSNAMTYMGAGALAGRSLGKAAGNLPENAYNFGKSARDTAQDKMEEYRYNKDKDMYGVGYAAEQAAIRQNERAEKQFLDNKEEQSKYEEMAGRIKTQTGQEVKTEDLMKAAFDYKKAGITDEKQIETGLAMEAKYGGVNGNKHDNMIDVVNMANNYGKDYVLDDKKRNSLQGVIKDTVKDEKSQNEVWNLYTEALGMSKETSKRYAINPPKQSAPQSPSQQPTQPRPSAPQSPSQQPTQPRPSAPQSPRQPRQTRPSTPQSPRQPRQTRPSTPQSPSRPRQSRQNPPSTNPHT